MRKLKELEIIETWEELEERIKNAKVGSIYLMIEDDILGSVLDFDKNYAMLQRTLIAQRKLGIRLRTGIIMEKVLKYEEWKNKPMDI